MSVSKESLDTPSIVYILSQYLERWIAVQENYLSLAIEKWQYTKEQTPERIQQSNRHMDIQEQRLEIQKAKIIAEHGNWPGIDLEG